MDAFVCAYHIVCKGGIFSIAFRSDSKAAAVASCMRVAGMVTRWWREVSGLWGVGE